MIAKARVTARFANVPMMSVLLVKMISEIIGSGSAILNTTWLMTKRFGGIDAERDHDEGRHHGDKAAQPDRNAKADKALHDHLTGHRPDRRCGNA